PVSYAVNAGDSITIDYLDGLTGAFGVDLTPIADARGYIDGIFGSGDPDGDPMTPNLTGIGSQSPLPSFYIDPLNVGPPIWLNALLGAFVDSSGKVIGTAFATGNDAYNVLAPTGAVALLLGVNDDLFSDNNGALRVSVTGSSVTGGVPEPATWAMMIAGFGLAGATLRRRRTANA
ncbi:MAG TPA: PEPxxWA-CTERM sorting domain-containing protein, partial [Phenylobacterium sp.]